MKKNNTLLFDGDMVVFQITIGHEQEIQWDDEVHTLHSRFSDCTDTFNDYMQNIMEELNAGHCVFAFSGTNNFRKEVLPTYKSNRKKYANLWRTKGCASILKTITRLFASTT